MIKLFTHENRMIVHNMKNLLAGEGIETIFKNEFAGGAVGDLPAFETWPELWLKDESKRAQAESIVQAVSQAGDAEDWHCGSCGESNGAAFQICWHCGQVSADDEGDDHG